MSWVILLTKVLSTKEINGKTYVISVNSDKNPVKITFSNLNKFKAVKVLTENRNIDISNGKLTDKYEAFGVHIYELIELN